MGEHGRMSERAMVLLSGGVDSTVLAYQLAREGKQLLCLSFRYGQRHADRELAGAKRTAARLLGHHETVVMHGAFGSSALTGSGDVPEVDASDVDGTRPVVVPGRNLVFLSIAASVAAGAGISHIYFAAHAGDAASFMDCRASFLQTLGSSFDRAGLTASVIAPFIRQEKSEIVTIGASLGVVWRDTYSCYVGKALHCGRCGACRSRRAAFEAAGVRDVVEGHQFVTSIKLR